MDFLRSKSPTCSPSAFSLSSYKQIFTRRNVICVRRTVVRHRARGASDDSYLSSYSRDISLISRAPEEPVDEDVVRERDVCVCWPGGGGGGRRRGEATHLLTMCGLITNQLRLDRGAPPSSLSPLTSPFIQTFLLRSFWRNLTSNLSQVPTLTLDLPIFSSNITKKTTSHD